MAQIVTITNPLTGQPVQVDQLEHTAQEIDDGVNAAGIESADYPGCYYRMVGDVVEWLNPPMLLGVEYRTTEQYLGKPLYTMLLQFDNLTSSQSYGAGGEIIRVSAECQYPDTSGKWIPLYNFSTGTENKTYPVIDFNSNYNRTLRVILDSSSPCLGKSCRVQMWYTKQGGGSNESL